MGIFEVHFDAPAFADQPDGQFQGDLFIAFAEDGEPRRAMHAWFNAPPVMRFSVGPVTQGEVVRVTIEDAVAMHPLDLRRKRSQEWRVQAIVRLSRTGREAGKGTGDVYSGVQEIKFAPDGTEIVTLRLDKVVEERAFPKGERLRLFQFKSPSLSKFHGFDYTLNAGVLLPENYDPEKKYPVLYSITGFGSDHRGIRRWTRGMAKDSPLQQCIIVIPDANNRYGHSVFCDSATNGPWGQALVHELIPALEKEFGGAGAAQRYVTGVSSGGWSSLWLQVTYPDAFNGCWSHVPDPIDFHDFQQINLYEPMAEGKPRNMFFDEEGGLRPVARKGSEITLGYRDFVQREFVLNPGGQIRSFEATFSPRLPDGTPKRIFDVKTGEVDHATAQTWRKYDISHNLLTNWEALKPKLAGKIRVYAGEVDTFYLEGAVIRFQKLAKEKGMLEDMVVEVVPGMAHSQHRAGFMEMEQTIEAGMLVGAGK